MQVFLTGATGFIASALIPELIGAGHQVVGLTRSDDGAQALASAGAQAHRGSLEDLESLRIGAQQSDAVVHLAYDHDFSKLPDVVRKESAAIGAIGAGLEGSDRPLILTSVTGMGAPAPGAIATEDYFSPDSANPRKSTEIAGEALAGRGVNVSVVRLSQIHSPMKLGFVSSLIRIAREKGVSAYVGDGSNRWPAAHVADVARLYRLVLEKGALRARYHAVAEEGLPLRDIAEAIARKLSVPVAELSPQQAGPHFGWLAMFATMDMPASSALTQQRLGWRPTGPGMVEDIAALQPPP